MQDRDPGSPEPVDLTDLSDAVDLTAPTTRRALRAHRSRRHPRRRRAVAAVGALAVVVTGLAGAAVLRPGSGSVSTTLGQAPAAADPTTSAPAAPAPGTPSAAGTPSGPVTTTPAPAAGATTKAAAKTGAAPKAGATTRASSPTKKAAPATTATKAAVTPKLRAGGPPFPTRCSVSATLVPSCGAYWGIYSRRYGGGNVETTVKTWESKIGRKFDIVLMYYDFSGRLGPGQFPDTPMRNLGTERILLIDWESRNFKTGANYRWADIAAGRYDATVVVPQAKRLKAYGKKVMLGLDHEMDLSYAKHGTAAEYKAAFKHIRSVFAAQGVDNVVWTWVTSGYVGYGNGPKVKSFYPGDAHVDWIGYDPYNFYTCHDSGWETFDQTVKGFYDWSAANGLGNKPLLLQEYGTTWGGATRTAQWYRDIDDVLRKRTRIKALVRWDSDTSCTLRIDAGSGAVAEFAAAGRAIDRP